MSDHRIPSAAIDRQVLPYARTDEGLLHVHVYRPRDAVPRAALLDIHGGAWTHFDPSVDFYWCEELARRGFLVASAEFRLAPRHPWPIFLCDVRAAARWLRAHAGDLGLPPGGQIGAIGGSTGGHLVALLSLWPSEPGHPLTPAVDTPDDADAHLDFAVPLWPILDVPGRYAMVAGAAARGSAGARPPAAVDAAARLRRIERLRRQRPWLGELVASAVHALGVAAGRFPPARRALYATLRQGHEGAFRDTNEMELASPLHLLRRGEARRRPPMLIVQGTADTNMTVAMTEAFVGEYRRQGGEAELVLPAGLGHSFGNIPSRAADELIDRIEAFVARVTDGQKTG